MNISAYQVTGELLRSHANTRVRDDDAPSLAVLIFDRLNGDIQRVRAVVDGFVGQRREAEFLDRIVRVRDELAQEDVPVRVKTAMQS